MAYTVYLIIAIEVYTVALAIIVVCTIFPAGFLVPPLADATRHVCVSADFHSRRKAPKACVLSQQTTHIQAFLLV